MFKHKRLILIFSLIFIAAAGFVFSVRSYYVPPILMYHSVTPQPDPKNKLAVRPETFDRQMRFLREHNYNVVTVEHLAGLIRERKKIPSKTVAITFDDGYKDNYTYAFAILSKYKIPATVFIIVNEVGRPQNDRLSWREIEEMADSGFISIGSHAVGPDPLIKMKTQSDLRYQIFDSKRMLEEKLLQEVTVFSYPEGMFTDEIRQLVIQAGYQAAVATKAKDRPNLDIYALKRVRISESAGNMLVFAVEASGYYPFLKGKSRPGYAK
jgi:peptidoglycan/xylan/chitin deacetylase (PgdA/CDA1 family)